MYDELGYTREELSAAMRETYDVLIDFVTSVEFKALCEEMERISETDRPQFVADVILSDSELQKRGIQRPDDILIQRSAFGDRRPTLFCVKKYLPLRFHNVWQNVNFTFDNPFFDDAISRDASVAWRLPVRADVQSVLMAGGVDLESVGDSFSIRPNEFGGPG
jgi:hypothetical protein